MKELCSKILYERKFLITNCHLCRRENNNIKLKGTDYLFQFGVVE